MMKLINTKSVLTLIVVSLLIGCKTVNDAIDADNTSMTSASAVSHNVGDDVNMENRHIEEVPEVLEMIEASKAEDFAQDAAIHAGSQQMIIEGSAAQICSDWKGSRGNANAKWLGKNIVFNGQMTSISHNSKDSESGNMVLIDADQRVSLGVVFSSIRETLSFRTGQNIAFHGELTEIKNARGDRCFFIVKNAVTTR